MHMHARWRLSGPPAPAPPLCPTLLQLAPAGRDAVHLQLARYSRAQGHATDAWDFLCTLQFATAPGEAQRHALMAEIRADAWTQVRLGRRCLCANRKPNNKGHAGLHAGSAGD